MLFENSISDFVNFGVKTLCALHFILGELSGSKILHQRLSRYF